jgi:hypothetical protein
MRIYEIVTEYTTGKGRFAIHDRFRIACETFNQALTFTQKKIDGKRLAIKSIEVVADTRL